MTLSRDLAALRARLREYEDTGLQAAPEAVRTIVAVLGALIEDAQSLEQHAAPAAARLPEHPPAHIVRLADWLAARADGAPGPGAAA